MIQSLILAISYGVGLAMDAFAVAVCKGLSMQKINYRHSFIIALFFGGFQALMPFLGYMLGYTFKDYITSVDHWVAFVLLSYIGGKMIYESLKGDDDECCGCERLDIKELFVLALATSIDALAIGIALSFDANVNIFFDASVIGITTFIIAFLGVVIGNKFGSLYKKRAEICGGIILIILGLRILITSLI